MRLVSGFVLAAALSVIACGGGGGSSLKVGADGGEAEGGSGGVIPGVRGNGGGAFGGVGTGGAGGNAGGAGGSGGGAGGASGGAGGTAAPDALPGSDGPGAGADGGTATPDAPVDRPRDSAPRDTVSGPADVTTTPDLAPPRDTSPPQPDTAPPGPCSNGTCNNFESQYQAALTRARSCNINLKGQCLQTTNGGLGCPGCKLWVNSTIELDSIRQMWTSAGCGQCIRHCPAVACRALTGGLCRSGRLASPPEPMEGDPTFLIIPPPGDTGTCVDQSDPMTF
jgi:hypothetical protein